MRLTQVENARHRRIIDRYQSGNTTKEIAEEFDITQRGVLYVLHRYGVEIKGKRRTNGRKVNEDFFKTWTRGMAYVLGFILTDGSVSRNTLSIAQNERYILANINNAMDSDCKISKYKNGKNDLYTLSIHRKEIIDDLKALGITEAKSRVVEFPNVPDEFLPHFIRGVIDGDGWIHDRGYVMNVTNASQPFSFGLYNVFEELGFNTRMTSESAAHRVWVSGKQDVIRLGEWLYEDCGDLYLRRKRERFFVNNAKRKSA